MAPNMPAELVYSALQMAIAQRLPAPGLIVLSDRGATYASAAHQAALDRNGLILSMSRKGNRWDNAVMERFFLNLKIERVWQRDYANHAEAMADRECLPGFSRAPLHRFHIVAGRGKQSNEHHYAHVSSRDCLHASNSRASKASAIRKFFLRQIAFHADCFQHIRDITQCGHL
ncbi:hypothetical protein ACMZ4X_05192 [Achromobacter marplatensis]